MNESEVSTPIDAKTLDEAQAGQVGGGLDLCSADELVRITASLTQSYENLVDFASHVIERVAGGLGEP
jgi:hypothetical protein